MVFWLPYVWAALAAAATAGFGYGAAAFAASAVGAGYGAWWPALVQAHGHLQVFGWGGLMVLGVGFVFLPRLRGAPLAVPSSLPWILGLMALGLGSRAAFQVAAAVDWSLQTGLGLAASGVLEFAGACVAVLVLVVTARRGPPLTERRGFAPVLPYVALSFSSLWIALALNALLLVVSVSAGTPLVTGRGDEALLQLGLEGFLVPISVAVAARSFPLFLWLRVPSPRALSLLFWPFAVGVALRVVGAASGWQPAVAAGSLLEGCSLVAFAVVLGVLPVRRRNGTAPMTDPHYLRSVEFLLVPAFLWLVVAGLLLMEMGLSLAGMRWPIQPDLARHAVGSGFVTLLILGMGQRMLPGFGGRSIASRELVWATVVLGNASALLRVVPPILLLVGLAPVEVSNPLYAAEAISGVLGLGAVVCFGVNLWATFSPRG